MRILKILDKVLVAFMIAFAVAFVLDHYGIVNVPVHVDQGHLIFE